MTAAGADRLDERREHVHLGGDQVAVDVVGLGDVDLGRAGRGQRLGERGRGAGGTGHDGGRLTQCAGGGDELGADLLERTLGVLDEHEYFCHGLLLLRVVLLVQGRDQMIFWPTR